MSGKLTVVSELERLKAELKHIVETREAIETQVKELNIQSGALIPEIATRKHTIAVLEGLSQNGRGGD